MKANNDRTIEVWYSKIKHGELAMPRYQRGGERWKPALIKKALSAFLASGPIGILLVSTKSQEQSLDVLRKFEDTNDLAPSVELLLDGQQRMQALWNSLNKLGGYECFIPIIQKDGTFSNGDVEFLRKSQKDAKRKRNNKGGFIFPFELLKPDDGSNQACTEWIDSIDEIEEEEKTKLKQHITKTRESFLEKIIPFFYLGKKEYPTEAEQISLFMTINTSYVKLTAFELTVADIESKIQCSLLDFADDLKKNIGTIEDWESTAPAGDYRELILKVGCLIQEDPLPPKKSYYMKLDYKALFERKDKIISSIESAVNYLEKEFAIGSSKVLPSVVPLRVLSALYFHGKIPRSVKGIGIARVIERYVWRAFLTEHYQIRANDRLKQDYISIKKYAEGGIELEILNQQDIFSMETPSECKLVKAGWPVGSGMLAKGVLLLASQEGARDLYDGQTTLSEPKADLHYHHIFPQNKIKGIFKDRKEAALQYHRVLNCMLLLGQTNEYWGKKWPSDALEDIVIEKMKNGISRDRAIRDLDKALQTHGLNYDMFEGCGSEELDDISPEAFKERYKRFLQARAKLIHAKIKEVCDD